MSRDHRRRSIFYLFLKMRDQVRRRCQSWTRILRMGSLRSSHTPRSSTSRLHGGGFERKREDRILKATSKFLMLIGASKSTSKPRLRKSRSQFKHLNMLMLRRSLIHNLPKSKRFKIQIFQFWSVQKVMIYKLFMEDLLATRMLKESFLAINARSPTSTKSLSFLIAGFVCTTSVPNVGQSFSRSQRSSLQSQTKIQILKFQ